MIDRGSSAASLILARIVSSRCARSLRLAALADSGLKVSTISRRAAPIAYAHKLAGFEPHEPPPEPARNALREASPRSTPTP